eukprot:1391553-Amorphochlora_amoeboformis.AAC.1
MGRKKKCPKFKRSPRRNMRQNVMKHKFQIGNSASNISVSKVCVTLEDSNVGGTKEALPQESQASLKDVSYNNNSKIFPSKDTAKFTSISELYPRILSKSPVEKLCSKYSLRIHKNEKIKVEIPDISDQAIVITDVGSRIIPRGRSSQNSIDGKFTPKTSVSLDAKLSLGNLGSPLNEARNSRLEVGSQESGRGSIRSNSPFVKFYKNIGNWTHSGYSQDSTDSKGKTQKSLDSTVELERKAPRLARVPSVFADDV